MEILTKECSSRKEADLFTSIFKNMHLIVVNETQKEDKIILEYYFPFPKHKYEEQNIDSATELENSSDPVLKLFDEKLKELDKTTKLISLAHNVLNEAIICFFKITDLLAQNGFMKSNYISMRADSQDKDYRCYYIPANIEEIKNRIQRGDFPQRNRKYAIRITQIGAFFYVWGSSERNASKIFKKDRSRF